MTPSRTHRPRFVFAALAVALLAAATGPAAAINHDRPMEPLPPGVWRAKVEWSYLSPKTGAWQLGSADVVGASLALCQASVDGYVAQTGGTVAVPCHHVPYYDA
ncbi:hypothetical protein [Lysobacter silvisoli]|uniref:Uncharacterized protein n=1 Tax=Lysobacter silvisoli TaxID=2293254 RepID=A0A371JZ69_9GAMM|nr:hypothetical protein [Lysobacter silvisoli]RDZ26978.1 hypothetical protein DX914_11950 [Lysobacter silvisoli]